jgi:hypothetical protein
MTYERSPHPPCPGCGRRIGERKDGQRKRHRVDDSDPVSAYCEKGAK